MASSSAVTEPGDGLQTYATESSRPLVSMAFIAPLLVIYELGVIVLGPHALRNGADTWLRLLLESLGFGQYFLLPMLTCGILLAWHHTRHDRWTMPGGIFSTMLLESVLLALVLFALAHIQRAVFVAMAPGITCSTTSPDTVTTLSRLIGYCGAGIYEELLFRLIMLPAVASILRSTGLTWRGSWCWAIVATSLFFSAAHYQMLTLDGYLFDWYTFSFRFGAGLFFSALFVARGFGIAVGTHAIYDVLVELL